jgi:hypothetical protein
LRVAINAKPTATQALRPVVDDSSGIRHQSGALVEPEPDESHTWPVDQAEAVGATFSPASYIESVSLQIFSIKKQKSFQNFKKKVLINYF